MNITEKFERNRILNTYVRDGRQNRQIHTLIESVDEYVTTYRGNVHVYVITPKNKRIDMDMSIRRYGKIDTDIIHYITTHELNETKRSDTIRRLTTEIIDNGIVPLFVVNPMYPVNNPTSSMGRALTKILEHFIAYGGRLLVSMPVSNTNRLVLHLKLNGNISSKLDFNYKYLKTIEPKRNSIKGIIENEKRYNEVVSVEGIDIKKVRVTRQQELLNIMDELLLNDRLNVLSEGADK